MSLISETFDNIIVSIDGSEEVHNRQRGAGAYEKTINNLERISRSVIKEKIQIACTLNSQLFSDEEFKRERNAVNKLKEKFPVCDIRFLPVLPLGLAENCIIKRHKANLVTVSEWIGRKYFFRTSCGLGQNLMVNSDGETYPCHVLKDKSFISLGNVINQDLDIITEKESFKQLRKITVDTIEKCRSCEVRYLCGGICLVWNEQDCKDLYEMGRYLLNDAIKILVS